MTKNLDLIEESEYWEKFSSPFLSYIGRSLPERKRVARDISLRKKEDLLLMDKFGFGIDSIFSGLTEDQIQYIAKNAPLEYKKEMVSIFQDKEMMDGVWEIAKAMDDDEGDSSAKNQDRIKKIIQYINDNRAVFQF